MDKCGSVIDRMNMKLGSKFLNTLGIQTQLIKRLQCVIVVNDATHSQKDGVESNGGSYMRKLRTNGCVDTTSVS